MRLPSSVRLVASLALFSTATLAMTVARPMGAQSLPVIETLVPLDSARRITVISPTLVTRLGLVSPTWPVVGAFREARLYRIDGGSHVLVVQRIDSTVARFSLDAAAVSSLQNAVGVGLLAQGRGGDRLLGAGSGVVVSQPAGNTFVRNQTFLGLIAYGPATAALLSKSSAAAAAGGYFLAAGTSFFVAANTVKGRVVTRAQAARAAHGGTRGALTGLGIAAIANADGGPGWGAPILAGAIGGTIAGFHQARGLSDGEAASAGFFADLAAITALGIGGSTGSFEGRKTVVTYGATVQRALVAAKQIEEEKGLSVEVIDLRTLSPWDQETVYASAKKTGRVIVAYEDSISWGYGAEIAARVADDCFAWLDAPVKRVASTDTFVGYAPSLEDAILPQVADFVRAYEEITAY